MVESCYGSVAFAVGFYTLCSSVVLIANKMAMHFNKVPGLVVCLQVAATVGYVLVHRSLGLSAVDEFDWPRIKAFLPYTVGFVVVLLASARATEASNVETIIVFRASVPLVVSILDYMVLGRELPSSRSVAALVGMVVSLVGYASADSEFLLNGIAAYGWVLIYVLGVTFEVTYGKQLCQRVKFNAPVWGQVLYCNALGFFPLLIISLGSGEASYLKEHGADASSPAVLALALSCFVGVAIAWSVWNCRIAVSATSYTLAGVVCKVITVILNVCIWDKHASKEGTFWLLVGLCCSSLYQQAPLRDVPYAAVEKAAPAEDAAKVDQEKYDIIGHQASNSCEDAS